MKFTARLPDGSVNVPNTHPLVELAWLGAGLAGAVVLAFVVLGWAGEYAAARLPVAYEDWLGARVAGTFPGEESPGLTRRLERLVAASPPGSPLRGYRFRAVVVDRPAVNAVAVPGGTVAVFRGLLDQVASGNELDMVLAHELGHFAHRDHLRNLGRGLGPVVLGLVLFGRDSAVSDLVASLCLTLEARYSREQESSADRFAVDLLVAANGHAGGATDLFRRLAAKAGPALPYVLASHPHPADRIREIEARIASRGYPVRATEPLD